LITSKVDLGILYIVRPYGITEYILKLLLEYQLGDKAMSPWSHKGILNIVIYSYSSLFIIIFHRPLYDNNYFSLIWFILIIKLSCLILDQDGRNLDLAAPPTGRNSNIVSPPPGRNSYIFSSPGWNSAIANRVHLNLFIFVICIRSDSRIQGEYK